MHDITRIRELVIELAAGEPGSPSIAAIRRSAESFDERFYLDMIDEYDSLDEAVAALVDTILDDARETEAEDEREARIDAEIDEAVAAAERLREIVDAVEAALDEQVLFLKAAGGSWYATWRRGYVELKLRVSDHAQPVGGGYSVESGERLGEADVEWLLSGGVPTRDAIRSAVAAAARRERGRF